MEKDNKELETLKWCLKIWKKEQKNKKSKYSDFFIQKKINEFEELIRAKKQNKKEI